MRILFFIIILSSSVSLFSQNVGIGTSNPKTGFHVAENKRVLFGLDTLGQGYKLMWLPDLKAFRVGGLDGNYASNYWNRDSIGLYSFASGLNTRAQGYAATTMGGNSEATNDYAFASGYFTNADGRYSTSMGFNGDSFGEGSTTLGYNCDAIENYTFGAGYNAKAIAFRSISIGSHTQSNTVSTISLGSYNIGLGNSNLWIDEDPILELGIGQSNSSRKNALTILKNGKHGIMTSQPKANLHVKEDGITGEGTIVAILESSTSDRPILQFSETSNGDSNSGMSIEYDGSGSGSTNKMYINKTGGSPIVTFENGGQVGIGTTSPNFALHLPDNSTTGNARAYSWTTYSDKRIKSKISILSYGLNTILKLKPVIYRQHNSTFENSKLNIEDEYVTTIGLLAQEAFEVIPESVIKPNDENEELWGMDYDKIIPVLIKGMQEQQQQIIKLQEEIKLLKSSLSSE